LLEEELAERFGTSRAPVREAMRILEHEGLVSYEPHRGVYVATLSEEEVEEIYSVRAEVEAIAARRVTVTVTAAPERLAPYHELLGQMRRAAGDRNVAELIAADLAFHRQMLTDSGYRFLPRVWASMDGIVRARTSALLAKESDGALITYNAECHAPIVAALASGKPKRAAATVRHHILETRDLWLSRR
jgi:DNA-binding GntR family transcriptional regulator